MRILKFRAWDTKRKKMWSAEEMGKDELTINPDGRGFVNVNSTSLKLSQYVPHLIPLQFIGQRDKKRTEEYPEGQEIYEYDKIKGTIRDELGLNLGTLEISGKVVWCDSFCCWGVVDGHFIHMLQSIKDIEVIGNAYEGEA